MSTMVGHMRVYLDVFRLVSPIEFITETEGEA